MRKFSSCLAIVAILWVSCNRSNDNLLGNPAEPILIKTITNDSTGRTRGVVHYNQFGIVADTQYSSSGIVNSIRKYEYNSKGNVIAWQWYLPSLYTAGNQWAAKFYYENDTILRANEMYTKDHLSTRIEHYYNRPGQLSVDSVFYYGLAPGSSVIHYNYDAQGSILSAITVKLPNDTAYIHTYQYTANTVEELMISISTVNNYKAVSKKITEFSSDRKILNEKDINDAGQTTSEITYSYDAANRLLNKKTVTLSSFSEEIYTYDVNGWLIRKLTNNGYNKIENVYTNNTTIGNPEKMEQYVNDKLSSTMIYYYQ